MYSGLFELPWWGYVVVALVLTHITIASVTIFLHRHQAHRALELHAIPSHFFRFWLWLTTGMVTREWAAIHRKHHAKCETEEDPHSPQTRGIRKVLFEGALTSLVRKRAAWAQSSTVPRRRLGIQEVRRASTSGVSSASAIGVRTQPGLSRLTRMSGASSWASDWVRPQRAALLAA